MGLKNENITNEEITQLQNKLKTMPKNSNIYVDTMDTNGRKGSKKRCTLLFIYS